MPEKPLQKTEYKDHIPYKNKTTGVDEMWDAKLNQRVFLPKEAAARDRIEAIIAGKSEDEVGDMSECLDSIYLNEILYEYPMNSMELMDLVKQAVTTIIAENLGKKLNRVQLDDIMKFLHNIFMQLEIMPKPKDMSRTYIQSVFLKAVQDGNIVDFMKENLDTKGKDEKKKDKDAGNGPQVKDIFYRIATMAMDRAKDFKDIRKSDLTDEQRGVLALRDALVNAMDDLPKALGKKIEAGL